MYKKALLFIILLTSNQKISSYVMTITHHYTYSTPLSQSLVMGELSTFLEECKYYSEEDIYFALQEFIRLRPLNAKEITSPSIKYVLKYLHKNLTQKVKRIENQIKHQYRFDYISLAASTIFLSIGVILNNLAYQYIQHIQPKSTKHLLAIPLGAFGTVSLCLSLINIPDIFNPNRDNTYLGKYKNVLKFVKKLQKHNYPYDNKLLLQQVIILVLVTSCLTTAYLALTAS